MHGKKYRHKESFSFNTRLDAWTTSNIDNYLESTGGSWGALTWYHAGQLSQDSAFLKKLGAESATLSAEFLGALSLEQLDSLSRSATRALVNTQTIRYSSISAHFLSELGADGGRNLNISKFTTDQLNTMSEAAASGVIRTGGIGADVAAQLGSGRFVQNMSREAVQNLSDKAFKALSYQTLEALKSDATKGISVPRLNELAELKSGKWFNGKEQTVLMMLDARKFYSELSPEQSSGLNAFFLSQLNVRQLEALSFEAKRALVNVEMLNPDVAAKLSTAGSGFLRSLGPAAFEKLSTNFISNLTVIQLDDLQVDAIQYLKNTGGIRAVTAKDLSANSNGFLAKLGSKAASGLSAEFIAALSSEQVARMKPEAINWLTDDASRALVNTHLWTKEHAIDLGLGYGRDRGFIIVISEKAAANLNSDFVSGLSSSQLTLMSKEGLSGLRNTSRISGEVAKHLGRSFFENLGAEGLGNLTAEFGAALHSWQVSYFSGKQLNDLSRRATENIDVSKLSAAIAKEIDVINSPGSGRPARSSFFQEIGSKQGAGFTREFIGALNPIQLNAMAPDAVAAVDQTHKISKDVAAQLHSAGHYTVAGNFLHYLSANGLQNLSDEAFDALPPAALDLLSKEATQAISIDQLNELAERHVQPNPYSKKIVPFLSELKDGSHGLLGKISPEQAKGLSENFLAQLNGKQLDSLEIDAIKSLINVAGISSDVVVELSYSKYSFLANLSPVAYKNLNGEFIGKLQAVHLDALSNDVTRSIVNTSHITAETVKSLNTKADGFLANLNISAVKGFSEEFVAALSKAQLQVISSNYDLALLNADGLRKNIKNLYELYFEDNSFDPKGGLQAIFGAEELVAIKELDFNKYKSPSDLITKSVLSRLWNIAPFEFTAIDGDDARQILELLPNESQQRLANEIVKYYQNGGLLKILAAYEDRVVPGVSTRNFLKVVLENQLTVGYDEVKLLDKLGFVAGLTTSSADKLYYIPIRKDDSFRPIMAPDVYRASTTSYYFDLSELIKDENLQADLFSSSEKMGSLLINTIPFHVVQYLESDKNSSGGNGSPVYHNLNATDSDKGIDSRYGDFLRNGSSNNRYAHETINPEHAALANGEFIGKRHSIWHTDHLSDDKLEIYREIMVKYVIDRHLNGKRYFTERYQKGMEILREGPVWEDWRNYAPYKANYYNFLEYEDSWDGILKSKLLSTEQKQELLIGLVRKYQEEDRTALEAAPSELVADLQLSSYYGNGKGWHNVSKVLDQIENIKDPSFKTLLYKEVDRISRARFVGAELASADLFQRLYNSDAKMLRPKKNEDLVRLVYAAGDVKLQRATLTEDESLHLFFNKYGVHDPDNMYSNAFALRDKFDDLNTDVVFIHGYNGDYTRWIEKHYRMDDEDDDTYLYRTRVIRAVNGEGSAPAKSWDETEWVYTNDGYYEYFSKHINKITKNRSIDTVLSILEENFISKQSLLAVQMFIDQKYSGGVEYFIKTDYRESGRDVYFRQMKYIVASAVDFTNLSMEIDENFLEAVLGDSGSNISVKYETSFAVAQGVDFIMPSYDKWEGKDSRVIIARIEHNVNATTSSEYLIGSNVKSHKDTLYLTVTEDVPRNHITHVKEFEIINLLGLQSEGWKYKPLSDGFSNEGADGVLTYKINANSGRKITTTDAIVYFYSSNEKNIHGDELLYIEDQIFNLRTGEEVKTKDQVVENPSESNKSTAASFAFLYHAGAHQQMASELYKTVKYTLNEAAKADLVNFEATVGFFTVQAPLTNVEGNVDNATLKSSFMPRIKYVDAAIAQERKDFNSGHFAQFNFDFHVRSRLMYPVMFDVRSDGDFTFLLGVPPLATAAEVRLFLNFEVGTNTNTFILGSEIAYSSTSAIGNMGLPIQPFVDKTGGKVTILIYIDADFIPVVGQIMSAAGVSAIYIGGTFTLPQSEEEKERQQALIEKMRIQQMFDQTAHLLTATVQYENDLYQYVKSFYEEFSNELLVSNALLSAGDVFRSNLAIHAKNQVAGLQGIDEWFLEGSLEFGTFDEITQYSERDEDVRLWNHRLPTEYSGTNEEDYAPVIWATASGESYLVTSENTIIKNLVGNKFKGGVLYTTEDFDLKNAIGYSDVTTLQKMTYKAIKEWDSDEQKLVNIPYLSVSGIPKPATRAVTMTKWEFEITVKASDEVYKGTPLITTLKENVEKYQKFNLKNFVAFQKFNHGWVSQKLEDYKVQETYLSKDMITPGPKVTDYVWADPMTVDIRKTASSVVTLYGKDDTVYAGMTVSRSLKGSVMPAGHYESTEYEYEYKTAFDGNSSLQKQYREKFERSEYVMKFNSADGRNLVSHTIDGSKAEDTTYILSPESFGTYIIETKNSTDESIVIIESDSFDGALSGRYANKGNTYEIVDGKGNILLFFDVKNNVVQSVNSLYHQGLAYEFDEETGELTAPVAIHDDYPLTEFLLKSKPFVDFVGNWLKFFTYSNQMRSGYYDILSEDAFQKLGEGIEGGISRIKRNLNASNMKFTNGTSSSYYSYEGSSANEFFTINLSQNFKAERMKIDMGYGMNFIEVSSSRYGLSITDLTIGGGGNSDVVVATDVKSEGGTIKFYAGKGDDFFIGGGSYGHSSYYVRGEDGADVIFGGRAADVLYGDEGDDLIFGGDGGDEIYGGEGNDQLFAGLLNADRSVDQFNKILAGSGDDFLFSSIHGETVMSGMDGDDYFYTFGEIVNARGGDGNDTFIFGTRALTDAEYYSFVSDMNLRDKNELSSEISWTGGDGKDMFYVTLTNSYTLQNPNHQHDGFNVGLKSLEYFITDFDKDEDALIIELGDLKDVFVASASRDTLDSAFTPLRQIKSYQPIGIFDFDLKFNTPASDSSLDVTISARSYNANELQDPLVTIKANGITNEEFLSRWFQNEQSAWFVVL